MKNAPYNFGDDIRWNTVVTIPPHTLTWNRLNTTHTSPVERIKNDLQELFYKFTRRGVFENRIVLLLCSIVGYDRYPDCLPFLGPFHRSTHLLDSYLFLKSFQIKTSFNIVRFFNHSTTSGYGHERSDIIDSNFYIQGQLLQSTFTILQFYATVANLYKRFA